MGSNWDCSWSVVESWLGVCRVRWDENLVQEIRRRGMYRC